jgi:hypothetical protein
MMRNGKGTTKRQECQQEIMKLQQAIVGVLKRHVRNTLRNIWLDKKKKLGQKGTPRDIEDIGYDVGRCQGHQEVHSGCKGTMVKKIVFLYSFKLEGAIEKHNTKDIGGHWKRPKDFCF